MKNYNEIRLETVSPLLLGSGKAITEHGKLALQGAVLINGGACVAILSFLGSVAKDETFSALYTLAAWSMVAFAVGVLCGGIAKGITYLSQCCHYDATFKYLDTKTAEKCDLKVAEEYNEKLDRAIDLNEWRRNVAIVFVSASLVLFLVGIVCVSVGFLRIEPGKKVEEKKTETFIELRISRGMK